MLPSDTLRRRVSLAAPAAPEAWSLIVVVDGADFRSSKNAVHLFEAHPCPGGSCEPSRVDVVGEERLNTTAKVKCVNRLGCKQ